MKMSTKGLSAALLLSIVGLGAGCASNHQEGVTSDYRTQWTTVSADPETVTAAAKQVFSDDKLTDVSAEMTKLDGMASGVTADKTKIQAMVKKSDQGSQLSVTVGKLGDPKVGANYVQKIKQVAEGKKM